MILGFHFSIHYQKQLTNLRYGSPDKFREPGIQFFLTTECGSFLAHNVNAYIKLWVVFDTRHTQSNVVRKFEKISGVVYIVSERIIRDYILGVLYAQQ